MSKITISFSLDDKLDADLLVWLERFGQRGRSAGIRAALRRDIEQNGVTPAEILAAVERLEGSLAELRRPGAWPEPPTDEAPEIPADIAASLDALGL